ncbi:DNA polymerase III subunit epsilon [Longibacter salinarum]|uniref:DNA polymerase III subunit epsilon n=1 Tax=Longibacter salinarum TaxID=1850348 RepID=A0A2A8D1U9_9BACT|nr:DEDD exonuclease domain-containing protein [Longibacter salinarum]PEN14860.1 DNA polymerase III subunit epsilon [Longibacter salinarum]
MTIEDATFVVTDTETTGTKAASNRVIEIGAVKVEAGEITDRFQQLINPERTIPSRITHLTGITTGMVFDKPTMENVMPQYLDFLGDGILVAHNLPFDLRFLNAECSRLGLSDLENQTLCSLRLARRLLPGLRSKGLSRLAQFYGINVNGRHRALGDAEATGIILKRFIRQLDFEHDIHEVDELLAFQNRKYTKVRKAPKHLKKLREDVLPDLPDAPGVYFLKTSSGKTLYIGKAKQLSDRVRSYFTAIESKDARKRKMMSKVRRVEWTVTDTELEALLLESRLIKEQKPSYNRAQKRYRHRPFIKLQTDEAFPRVGWQRAISDDGAEYYGPLRSRKQAELVIEVISRFFGLRECDDSELSLGQRCLYADMERCTAPCENEDEERYAVQVDRVREFLCGQDTSVLDELEERMQQASRQLEFEKAATFRDWLQTLERMLAKQKAVAAPVLDHNAALVHPHQDEGTADVLLVRFGKFARSLRVNLPLSPDRTSDVAGAVEFVFDDATVRPDELTRRDQDEIRLLSHWMYMHRSDLLSVRRGEGGLDDFVTRIVATLNQTTDMKEAA